MLMWLQAPGGGTSDPTPSQLPWNHAGGLAPQPPTCRSCTNPGTARGEGWLCGTPTCRWAQSKWARQETSSFQAGSRGEACPFCPVSTSFSPPPLVPGQQGLPPRHQALAHLLTLACPVPASLPPLLDGQAPGMDPPAQRTPAPPSQPFLRSGHP